MSLLPGTPLSAASTSGNEARAARLSRRFGRALMIGAFVSLLLFIPALIGDAQADPAAGVPLTAWLALGLPMFVALIVASGASRGLYRLRELGMTAAPVVGRPALVCCGAWVATATGFLVGKFALALQASDGPDAADQALGVVLFGSTGIVMVLAVVFMLVLAFHWERVARRRPAG